MITNRDSKKEEILKFLSSIKFLSNLLILLNLFACVFFISELIKYKDGIVGMRYMLLGFYIIFIVCILVSFINVIVNNLKKLLLEMDLEDQKQIAWYFENEFKIMKSKNINRSRKGK